MVIKFSVSLLFVTLIILSTFTFIHVPYLSIYSTELHGQTITFQWKNLVFGTYLANLQILVVIFTCLCLRGAALITISLYLLMGFGGFSIFYYGGGMDYLHQDTLGYLLSFLPAAVVCTLSLGKPVENTPPNANRILFSGMLSLLVIHLIGGFYTSFYYQMIPLVYFFEYIIPQIFWQISILVILSVGLASFYRVTNWYPRIRAGSK